MLRFDKPNGSYDDFQSDGQITNGLLGGLIELVTGIFNAVTNIPKVFTDVIANLSKTITDFFSPTPEQAGKVDQFGQDVGETTGKIDEANKVIEDNSNRPSADELAPETPDIFQGGVIGGGDATATAMVDGFGELLSMPFVLNTLLLVFTLAFVSYVLFGKKE